MTIDPKDDELMLLIRRKNADPALADEAFTTLYERHHQLLFKSVENANHKLVGFGVDAAEIVIETFDKVWNGAADTFKPGNYDKPDGRFVHVQFWLQTIAKNLFKETLRKPDNILPIDPIDGSEILFGSILEEFDTDTDESGNDSYEWLHRLVANTLNKKEQAIVWFKINTYDRETGKSEPPADQLEEFCREWKIKPPALRKAYSRALEKLAKSASGAPQPPLQPASTKLGDSNAYTE